MILENQLQKINKKSKKIKKNNKNNLDNKVQLYIDPNKKKLIIIYLRKKLNRVKITLRMIQ